MRENSNALKLTSRIFDPVEGESCGKAKDPHLCDPVDFKCHLRFSLQDHRDQDHNDSDAVDEKIEGKQPAPQTLLLIQVRRLQIEAENHRHAQVVRREQPVRHQESACADCIERSVGLFEEECLTVGITLKELVSEACRPTTVANEETKKAELQSPSQL